MGEGRSVLVEGKTCGIGSVRLQADAKACGFVKDDELFDEGLKLGDAVLIHIVVAEAFEETDALHFCVAVGEGVGGFRETRDVADEACACVEAHAPALLDGGGGFVRLGGLVLDIAQPLGEVALVRLRPDGSHVQVRVGVDQPGEKEDVWQVDVVGVGEIVEVDLLRAADLEDFFTADDEAGRPEVRALRVMGGADVIDCCGGMGHLVDTLALSSQATVYVIKEAVGCCQWNA